jgi:hypothetical protein
MQSPTSPCRHAGRRPGTHVFNAASRRYSSVASSVIAAFSTFDIGQFAHAIANQPLPSCRAQARHPCL